MKNRAWQHIVYGGAPSAKKADQEAAHVLNIYSLLAFIVMAVFGALNLADNPTFGYLELAGAACFAINMIGLRLTKNIWLGRVNLMLIMLGMLFVMAATGGTAGTGIFWFFAFPVGAYFLTGRKQGTVWMIAMFVMIFIIMALNESVITTPYSFITYRQLAACLLVVAIGLYVYERSREILSQTAHDSMRDLQQYIDQMSTFTAKIQPDGTVSFANQAAKHASGMGEQFIGSNFLDGPWWRFDPAVQNRVRAAFKKVLDGTPVSYDEDARITTDSPEENTVIRINFSMQPVFQKSGRVQHVIAEGRDISAEQAVDRAKSQFVTLASHQLRTPISAISWICELLLIGDAGKLTQEQWDYLDQIYRSNRRSIALVDAMLMVSSIELGTIQIKPEPLKISELAHDTVETLSKDIPIHKHVVVEEKYDPQLPELPLDREITKMILHNLISNALKYTLKGKITISLSKVTDKLNNKSTGSLLIQITDTGLGIPHAAQDRVFSKLFRADNVRHKDTDGTGLGLFIVKNVVEYVGGRMSFTSTENKGSSFSVWLPIEGMAEQLVKDDA